MGLMDRLRNSTKIIFWVLILAFGLLWGLADTGAIDAVMLGPRSLGEVNGQAISSEDYNGRINAYTQRYQEATGDAPTMEMRAYYEELAWDELVIERIIASEMKNLGILVTDEEIVDMITGATPHPMVAQFFTREDGSIDRLAMQAAIEAPENTEIWINIESQLREQRGREKLNAYIESALRISDNEIREEYRRENSTASFSFVRFPYSAVDESEITVSDSEIRSYYRANSDRFKQENTWRFKYVEFSKLPTAQDTIRTYEELNSLREEFATAADDSFFVTRNFSDASFFGGWLNASEVNWYLADALQLPVGGVTQPIAHDGNVSIAKNIQTRRGTSNYTRVRLIRLNFSEGTKSAMMSQARDIVSRVNGGESFVDIARVNSNDPTSVRGGELGYVNRSDYNVAIGNAIFNGRVGTVTNPIEDGNSYVIYHIVDRTNLEIRIGQFTRRVEADPGETISRQLEQAQDFQEYAILDGFEQEAERNNLIVSEAFATEGVPFIAGIGQSRILLNELAKVGRLTRTNAIPEFIELDDKILVIKITEIVPEGTRPMDEVRAQIESTLRTEKRKEITRSRVASLLSANNTLEALAQADSKEVQRASTLRMSTNTIPGAGREPAVIGAAFGAELNTVSGVVSGENAAFVIVVDERVEADLAGITAAYRQQSRQRLAQAKSQAFQEVWLERLKEEASIVDYRGYYN